MTVTQRKHAPSLRFPGFVGEWCKTTIGQNFEFKNGLNKEKEFFGHGTPIINFVDVYHLTAIHKKQVNGYVELSNKEMANFSVRKGDVFFTRTSETINDIGMSATLVEDIENCVFSGFVLRARPVNKKLDNLYKSYCFSIEPVRKEIVTKSSYTTRALTSGRLLNKVCFYYPNDLQEQQKVAAFLSAVDTRLEQLNRKKTLLEQYKKGIMQKLFSQEFQFKDEHGNDFSGWKEKKLGELCKITTGKLDANAMVDGGQYRFYTCAREYYWIDKFAFDADALLISGNGVNVGYIHYYSGKFNAYQRTYVLDQFEENIFYIKFYLEQHLQKRINYEKKVGNTPYIVLNTLADMPLKTPCEKEQQKFADCLSAIDKKIKLVAAQLEQARTFKKGLLQQMFI